MVLGALFAAGCSSGSGSQGELDAAQPEDLGGVAPDAGSASDLSEPADLAQSPAVKVSWEYPVLFASGTTQMFPTYLAHLLGIPGIVHPLELHTACANLSLASGAAQSVSVEVRFPSYGAPATQNVLVAAGTPQRVCLDPVFDLDALYALTAGTAGRVETYLRDASNTPLDSKMQPVTIMPGNDILWARTGVADAAMVDLSVVYTTPHDPAVEALLTSVQARSRFKQPAFQTGGYGRAAYARTVDIAVNTYSQEVVLFEPGDAPQLSWTLTSVAGGVNNDIDVFLFQEAEFQKWTTGMPSTTVGLWLAQSTAASALTAIPSPGVYRLVLLNNNTNFVSRAVTWTRSITREEISRDALNAIYDELKSRGITYLSVTGTYFASAQHIKRPSEVLTTLSANCIDGSLLFASLLELIGMEPVIIFKTGHAYVGVRSAPGSGVVWPVETTWMGTDPFGNAYAHAISRLPVDAANDPQFHLVDVKTMRTRKLTPRPK